MLSTTLSRLLHTRLTICIILSIVLVIGATGSAQPLHAQGKLDGTYTLKGVDLNGKEFSAEFTLTAEKDVYRFQSQDTPGVGLVRGSILAIAYGAQCGVALYGVAPDGTLSGNWATTASAYAGSERAVPDGGTSARPNYLVTGTMPSGNPYRGVLRIAQNDAVLTLTWISGQTTNGVGLTISGALGSAYGAANCGLLMLQVQSDGSLSGQITAVGQSKASTVQVAIKGSGDSSTSSDSAFGLGDKGEGNASGDNAGSDNSGSDSSTDSSNTDSTNTDNSSSSALAVNAEAEVTEAGNELYLLESAEIGAKRQTVLLTGDPLLLLEGPTEADGYTWWKVKTVDGRTGFILQGFADTAYIAPSTDELKVDADSTESTYYLGARCTLDDNSKFTVTVRDQPSRGAQAIKRIENSSQVVVIVGGPVVADERRWWQVRLGADSGDDAADERIGWFAEEDEAFLKPLQSPEAVLTVKGGDIKVGANIRVTGSGGELPMHQDPDVKTTPISTLDQTADATVISGPVQAQGFTWWEVKRVKDGIRGWIAVAPGWIENYNG
jgi:hypothetical protein